ncbi:MAG: phage major capsid protein [Clostridia bacterium]|nr:phage major capsid protein [Clostridia bacterium]
MNYDSIRLEKGMYASSKGFAKTLEELDPSEQYEGTPLAGLDAFQRQLKRFDIKVGGASSDTVEKFFKTTDSAALFPEYVARAVRQGAEGANLLSDIVATTTRIDSMDYRTITSVPADSDKELKDVAEGAEIPRTRITTQDNLVSLHKRGRMLVASYEALRFQRLDLFTVTLRQIGAYIARQQFADAANVLINGDGNDNAAPVQKLIDSAAGLSYEDLIAMWNGFEPYELNTFVASPEAMAAMLAVEEFKDPATGLNFQATGRLVSPLGAKIVKSNLVPAGKLIGLDKNCALEMVVADDIRVDYDKLIDRQLERAAITSIAGFAKIFADASKVISLN